MIKLIITDIGGVLVKTDEAIISSIKKACKINGLKTGNIHKLMNAFGVSIYDYIKHYLDSESEEMVEKVYSDFKLIFPAQVIQKFKVFLGVNKTLLKLKEKGIKIAIISCMHGNEVQAALSHLKFKDFDAVLSIEEYKLKRPNPKGLQIIMEKFGVNSQETIYVGDTIADIDMAKAAGIKSVAVKTGLQKNNLLKNEEPDYLLKNFNEIINII
ncbi:HAD family hydrolase [Candidatus Woesearchaeota archaeon]|nr:HAD family hydrolase [Candidatus Woesearchaeota archaeon]MCF7901538.1 HAD family hydrolase [Candidatus Woesearchaeota archaeon]MCF8013966.1 HAD family hydrolase [Candidatus Woesearchaeota archaeon]